MSNTLNIDNTDAGSISDHPAPLQARDGRLARFVRVLLCGSGSQLPTHVGDSMMIMFRCRYARCAFRNAIYTYVIVVFNAVLTTLISQAGMPREVIERAAKISQRLRSGLPITPFSLQNNDPRIMTKKSKIADEFLQVKSWDVQNWEKVNQLINMLKSL